MMKAWTTLLLMFLPVATPTPVVVVQQAAASCTTANAAFVHGSSSSSSSSTGSAILSSSTLMSSTAAVFTVPRGGDAEGDHGEEGRLHHPETTEDVEALILKAASMNQLVVIDFTASWYVQEECDGIYG